MTQAASTRPSYGLVNGRPLFLDLDTDSYFLIEPDEEADLLSALAGNPDTEPGPVNRARPSCELDPATAEAARISLRDLVSIWRALRHVRRALKSRPLTALIDEIVNGKGRSPATSKGSIEMLALHFQSARRWLPHAPNCLSDSLALVIFLKGHDHHPDLVFGAKLDPFAAHCWIECDGKLLNDHLDRIEGFVPVAVVKT